VIPRLASAVVANSQATLAALRPPAGVGRVPASVIADSVELPVLSVRPAGGAAVFGMLGRIAPWKGQDLFLRAFAQAFGAGEERAVIIGAAMFGEEDFERSLPALALELGIAPRVEFRGFREDVWSELAALDVLVHSSVIPEPFGQVVLEGMAAGLPVLAADEGGPAAVIDDGRTGRLFASRDQDALAAAMRELAGDPGTRARLGAAAREAASGYRPEAIAEAFERLYSQLLK
jgi:glycosyltransferase involved in cell wall biosynthesis